MKEWVWSLKDLPKIKEPEITVMSVFSGGGGSTMGHKLQGHNVIANVEIDPKQNSLYKENFNPKYSYEQDIREVLQLAKDKKLPEELYNLNFFDGSPPCTSFTVQGLREKAWGVEKKFKEGQASQTLDDLFFVTLDLIDELKPEIFCLENVKGIVLGPALTEYTHKIIKQARDQGYHCQWVMINSIRCNVPQSRERVFFIGLRKDLHTVGQLSNIIERLQRRLSERVEVIEKENSDLFYGEVVKEAESLSPLPIDNFHREITGTVQRKLYFGVRPSERTFNFSAIRQYGKGKLYSNKVIDYNRVHPTLTAGGGYHRRDEPTVISDLESTLISSFPWDYNFLNQKPLYVCGMSVPPLMSQVVIKTIMNYKDSIVDEFEEW